MVQWTKTAETRVRGTDGSTGVNPESPSTAETQVAGHMTVTGLRSSNIFLLKDCPLDCVLFKEKKKKDQVTQ